MEFREFKTPEQTDYDLNFGLVSAKTTVTPADNSLNIDEGFDLNSLADDSGMDLSALGDSSGFNLNELNWTDLNKLEDGITINQYGEILREGKKR